MRTLSCEMNKSLQKHFIVLCTIILIIIIILIQNSIRAQFKINIFHYIRQSAHFNIYDTGDKSDLQFYMPQSRSNMSASALLVASKDHNSIEEKNGFGYILVSHYSDQITGASLNILSLQCWASSISDKVRVVEPFIHHGSGFGAIYNVHSSRSEEVNLVRLRDILDINSWEEQGRHIKLSPLASWENFLRLAPRNLIIVNRDCFNASKFKSCVHCDNNEPALSFARRNSYNLIRQVCYTNKLYSKEEFKQLVYGGYEPHNAAVIFNHWGGISNLESKSYRIGIHDMKKCNRRRFSSFLFENSQEIVLDSDRYIEQYMPEAIHRGYISVMFRVERFLLNHNFGEIKSMEKKLSILTKCVDGIAKLADDLKAKYDIKSVFLAMDCRKQGSKVFKKSPSPDYLDKELIDSVVTKLYQKLYGNSSSLEEWDESFEKTASFQTPGYVAQLQKNLAARGRCLLTAGGGGFQQSALDLFRTHHNNISSSSTMLCAMAVPECT